MQLGAPGTAADVSDGSCKEAVGNAVVALVTGAGKVTSSLEARAKAMGLLLLASG